MAEKIWRGGIGLRPPPGLRRYWRPLARLTTGISGSTLAQNASEIAQDFILILYQLFTDKFLVSAVVLRQCSGFAPAFSTTVVDRRPVDLNRAFDSGSGERGVDAVFAIGTSKEDAQRRAIRAQEGV